MYRSLLGSLGWVAAAVAVTLLGLPVSAPAASRSAPGVAAHHRLTVATAARRRRPTCGYYCRQAGGGGAGPPGSGGAGGSGRLSHAVFIPNQVVLLGSDNVVGIKAECRVSHTCKGAIILGHKMSLDGQDDLRIPAHQTRVVYVLLLKYSAQEVRRRGYLRVSASAYLAGGGFTRGFPVEVKPVERRRSTVAAAARRRRPTCGSYCRQAGGAGGTGGGSGGAGGTGGGGTGGGGGPPQGVVIPDQVLALGADDVIGVKATCVLKHPCVGAMVLHVGAIPMSGIGRDDLRIPSHKTRVVYVVVQKRYARQIRRQGYLKLSATAYLKRGNNGRNNNLEARPTSSATVRGGAVDRRGSTKAVEARRRRNPTCGSFCRQAGGTGGGRERPGVFIPNQLLRLGPDNVVGVRAECRTKNTCKGAMIIRTKRQGPISEGIGRDDLEIGAHQTKVVYVQISMPYARQIRRQGRLRNVFVAVYLSSTGTFNASFSNDLTIVPA